LVGPFASPADAEKFVHVPSVWLSASLTGRLGQKATSKEDSRHARPS
jgi:hypothetical protein